MITDKEKLKTFLIVKYGTLARMYASWLLNEIELSEDEKAILAEYNNEEYTDMLITKFKVLRGRHGIFQ